MLNLNKIGLKPLNTAFRLLFSAFFMLFTACGNEKAETEKEPAGSVNTEEKHEEHEASENAVELTAEQFQTAGIATGTPAKRNMSSLLKVNGMLDVPPQNMVSISAPLGGFVKSTEMLQGMQVRKGQTIAIIENTAFVELQQEYLESKSRLDYLTLEYERQKELRQENVNSAKTFQQVTSEYRSAKARTEGIAAKLALIGITKKQLNSGSIIRTAPITAPISGYVSEVHVNVGVYANPTDVLFTLVDPEHLHAELVVFEKDIEKIKKGQKVRFKLHNETNRTRTATVYLIGKKIDEARTVRIHAHLDEEEEHLLPGAYIIAEVEVDEAPATVLPLEAVVQSEGKNYVFLPKGKRQENGAAMFDYQLQEIKVGVSEDGFIAVTLPEGMNEQTPVVTKGAYALLSKLKNTEDDEGHGH